MQQGQKHQHLRRLQQVSINIYGICIVQLNLVCCVEIVWCMATDAGRVRTLQLCHNAHNSRLSLVNSITDAHDDVVKGTSIA